MTFKICKDIFIFKITSFLLSLIRWIVLFLLNLNWLSFVFQSNQVILKKNIEITS